MKGYSSCCGGPLAPRHTFRLVMVIKNIIIIIYIIINIIIIIIYNHECLARNLLSRVILGTISKVMLVEPKICHNVTPLSACSLHFLLRAAHTYALLANHVSMVYAKM